MTLKVSINLLQDNNGVAGEPISQDRISVNDSFFVEISVADVRDNPAGIIGLALALQWDASILEALDTEVTNTITSSLPVNPQGTIDNENGLIDNLGAGAVPNFDLGEPIGINEPERFALLHFKGELATDNPIPLTVTVSDPRTVAFADGLAFDGETDIEAQTLEINPENTPPTLVNEIADVTTSEDSEFSLTIPENTFNDVDAGDTLTYSATLEDGGELPAWLTFNPTTRSFSGVPTNNDLGTLNIKVTATDNAGKIASYSFLLTIDDFENHAPEADNDMVIVSAQSDPTITINVLDNDTDADGDDLTIDDITTESSHGITTVNSDGTISYTPDLGFSGVDSFDYQVSDSNGGTDTATVTVDVKPLVMMPEIESGMLYDATPVGDNTLTTTLSEDILDLGTDADFDNLVGFYEVTGTDGGIDTDGDGVDDLLPDDTGYAQAALSNSIPGWEIRAGSDGDISKNTTVEQFGDVVIAGGKIYAPFVIARGGEVGIDGFIAAEAAETDGVFNDAATNINDMVAYFSFLGANPDGAPHIQAYGDGVFGFEDLPANLTDVESDNDFNDAMFKFVFDM